MFEAELDQSSHELKHKHIYDKLKMKNEESAQWNNLDRLCQIPEFRLKVEVLKSFRISSSFFSTWFNWS